MTTKSLTSGRLRGQLRSSRALHRPRQCCLRSLATCEAESRSKLRMPDELQALMRENEELRQKLQTLSKRKAVARQKEERQKEERGREEQQKLTHDKAAQRLQAAEHVKAAEQQRETELHNPSEQIEASLQSNPALEANQVEYAVATEQHQPTDQQEAAELSAGKSEERSTSSAPLQSSSPTVKAQPGSRLSDAADDKSIEPQFAEAFHAEISRTAARQEGALPRRGLHDPSVTSPPSTSTSSSPNSWHLKSSPKPAPQSPAAPQTLSGSTSSDEAQSRKEGGPPSDITILQPTLDTHPSSTDQTSESDSEDASTASVGVVQVTSPSTASDGSMEPFMEASIDSDLESAQVAGLPPESTPAPQPPSPPPIPPPMRSRPPESAAAAADAAALMNSRANADERFKGFACTSKHKRTLSMAEIQHEMSNKILKTPSAALLALRERVQDMERAPRAAESDAWSGGAFSHYLASDTYSIIFVSAEVAPYSKTGGLGDVAGSLPIALADRGHRVMVISPRYLTNEADRRRAARLHDCATWVKVEHSKGEHWVNFHHEHRDCVDWVFVEHACFQRDGGLYGNNQGIYGDNTFRFSLLCLAACEAALQLQLPIHTGYLLNRKVPELSGSGRVLDGPALSNSESSDEQKKSENGAKEAKRYDELLGADNCSVFGEDVIFVANDWHAGMTPVYLRHKYQANGVFNAATSILAIHNLAHQGTSLANSFPDFKLPQHVYSEMEWIYTEKDGRRTPVVNIMKAAILNSGRVVTVSESYAWEITREEQGVGLHSILQEHSLRLNGIVNGMDRHTWNPETDTYLPATFSSEDLSGKATCKAALRRQLGLPEPQYGVDVPLVGFVGRLDPQKGPDLIIDALSAILSLDCQVVMLGSGHPNLKERIKRAQEEHSDSESFHGVIRFSEVVMLGSGHPNLEERIKSAQEEHPDFFRGIIRFSETLAHRIIAASDVLLMPSRFEPCGLNQMYALRYGAIPVGCATGGIRDTIVDVSPFTRGDEPLGTGWTFSPATPAALAGAMKGAVQVYREHPEQWLKIQKTGMAQNFGWGRAARAYEQVIRSVRSESSKAAGLQPEPDPVTAP